MSKQAAGSIAKNVPFNQIYIDPEENSRRDLRNLEKLAEQIKEQGLLTALTVTNGGSPDPDKPYKLRAGYRRAGALGLLKWGSKEVPIVVVEDKETGIKNLVENVGRENLPSIDLAQRLGELEAGTAPGTTERYTKKELAAKLNMSASHVSNLIRADKNLTIEAKKVWRKHDVPTTTVFAWAGLDEEGQLKAIAKWESDLAKQKARAAGRSEGEGGEGGEARGKRGKKGKKNPEETKKPLVKGKNASLIESYKECLEWQLETGVLKGQVDKEAAIRQIDTFRFLLGDLARMPGVTAADMKAHEKWVAEMEAEEAAAAEEELEEDGE